MSGIYFDGRRVRDQWSGLRRHLRARPCECRERVWTGLAWGHGNGAQNLPAT